MCACRNATIANNARDGICADLTRLVMSKCVVRGSGKQNEQERECVCVCVVRVHSLTHHVGNAALKFVGEVVGRVTDTVFERNPTCVELVQHSLPTFSANRFLESGVVVRCHEAIVCASLLTNLATSIKSNQFMNGTDIAIVLHGFTEYSAAAALVSNRTKHSREKKLKYLFLKGATIGSNNGWANDNVELVRLESKLLADEEQGWREK